ncbi:Kinesin-like protein KIN-14I [Glycine soja]
MNSVFSINTTAHVALFRALHRAPQCALLCHNLKCLVTFYNSSSNYCRIPCSFSFVPSPSSLRSVCGLLLRTLCCISSFAASFASPAGGGNGSAGTGDSGRGDDSGSESGDANLKLVGDAIQELSGLSPNVIILDVLELAGIIKLSTYSSFSLFECRKVVTSSKSPDSGNRLI